MKNLFAYLRKQATPVILSVALLLTGLVSFSSIEDLQGNARVINYTGIVRGATQRLIKKELNRLPDDALILRLDRILAGLSDGSGEFRLTKLQDPEYRALLAQMRARWTEIKAEILRHRDGAPGEPLFTMSESYFVLADRAVLSAENFTEQSVQKTRQILLYMNLLFVLLALLNAAAIVYQERRRRRLRAAEERNRLKSERLKQLSREILVPMNEISELVYISDLDTYELLFVNHAGRETFHLDEIEGVKCYRALQGFDEPCPFCTNSRLKADENFTWEYTNPLTKRHYLLKDRLVNWDGRPAKLEIAFDITDAANEKTKLENRLASDQILLECIRELYRNHEVSQAIQYALELIGGLFQAERAYIFSFHGKLLSNTAEWCGEGVTSQRDSLQNLRQTDFHAWVEIFQKQENVMIDDVESLKGSHQTEYEILFRQDIRRAVIVPLERGGTLNGFIGLDNLPRNLLENAALFLQTFRYFLMLAVNRSEDEKKLSQLSYHDTLTSFYNRNRYMKDIEALREKQGSIGVAYLDINGLKEVNDRLGHDAGDRLLKECARLIRGAVSCGAFYRIGGDEFVVLCPDIGRAAFAEMVDALRQAFAGGACRAAIGSEWAETGENLQSVIVAADEAMYADKKAFYQKHRLSGRYRH